MVSSKGYKSHKLKVEGIGFSTNRARTIARHICTQVYSRVLNDGKWCERRILNLLCDCESIADLINRDHEKNIRDHLFSIEFSHPSETSFYNNCRWTMPDCVVVEVNSYTGHYVLKIY